MSKTMKQLDSKTRRLLHDPAARRAWVKYQIHMQGRSMAAVADEAGVNRQTLYQAFQRTYPRMEKVIADAVGVEPAVLWPERYDEHGLPLYRMGRPKRSRLKKGTTKCKPSSTPIGRNVESRVDG
ncbi:helix-turn-helix domain-containing protein [Guyparkeria halophila]|uniref:Helix-turn-helix domain-containing protein n=1 Tax=Guyparkeria halophila TaxID=47960 RepID=A0ABZ0YVV8_9GAMM|nr:helix-turn-helix domain-containing protein [Guyparkeria halophila]WQH16176.1 helix-turn-helix domain-containing protein [Guyparkeria halophila]